MTSRKLSGSVRLPASPGKQGPRGPRYPDLPGIVLRNVDATGPSQPRTLRRHIGTPCPAALEQPLPNRGVETAGHGVLDQRAVPVAKDRADLECRLVPGGVRADDADVDPPGMISCRFEREHGIGGPEHHGDPPRAVVDPGRIDDRAPIDPEHRRDFGDLGRGGIRLQAALCALELLMPVDDPAP